MKSLLTLVVLIALAAPLVSAQSQQQAPGELKPLPELTLHDFDGKPVSAETLKGSIIVLDFWATWCGPCIMEIPEFNKIQKKYADKGVKVVGVTVMSGSASEVKSLMADRKIIKHPMEYTVFMGKDEQAYDFNIIGFPTTFVITPDSKIYKKYTGVTPKKSAEIEADIERLLEKHGGR